MHYQTFPPSPELAAFIHCYWTLEAPKEDHPEKQRIIPDGCMEMIFHQGDPYKQYLPGGGTIMQPRCFVFGQITAPLDIEPTGQSRIFSVRFNPDGFTPFASLAPAMMENRAVPLTELFGEEGGALEQSILEAGSTTSRIVLAERFLLKKLATQEAVDSIVKAAVEILVQLKGNISIDALSGQLKTHRRQLERKFSSIIGLSPKQLSKMIRMQSTLKILANDRVTSLTSLAYEGEYYDQAHFIKDFKEFTGVTPGKFYSDNLRMSALFSGIK
jgi:AraC-like DNA-binding protein